MGLCVSSHITRQGGVFMNLPSAAQVIHWNGRLQELWQPTRASEILSQNPNCFLCSSETMNVNSVPLQMAKDEQLQPGQFYFLMPTSKLRLPFSLQDLCTLAVKASKALNDSDMGRIKLCTSVILPNDDSSAIRFYGGTTQGQGSCRVANRTINDGIVGIISHISSWTEPNELLSTLTKL